MCLFRVGVYYILTSLKSIIQRKPSNCHSIGFWKNPNRLSGVLFPFSGLWLHVLAVTLVHGVAAGGATLKLAPEVMEESSPSEAPRAPAIFSELRVDVGFIPNLDPVVDFPIANQFANRTAIGTEVLKFTTGLTLRLRNGDSVDQPQGASVRYPFCYGEYLSTERLDFTNKGENRLKIPSHLSEFHHKKNIGLALCKGPLNFLEPRPFRVQTRGNILTSALDGGVINVQRDFFA